MSQTGSPSTQRRYGLARVCRMWGLARSTVYLQQARRATTAAPAQKRGPKPQWSDAVLLEQIRAVLAASPFLGEGHRKVWARIGVGQDLRPQRLGCRPRERRLPPAHDGLGPVRSRSSSSIRSSR